MIYNRKNMDLELSAEDPVYGGFNYAELSLPAADYEIKDAMQQLCAVGRENEVEISISDCDILPELQDIRFDTFCLDELNFLAKRLTSLTDEELPVFYAVTEKIFDDAYENENLVSIKDLINSTYGLDTVSVIHNVGDLSELGQFAFENGLLPDLDGIPESALPFLNTEQIGRVQQKNDNGVFEGQVYIPTVHYDRPEVYDGVTLPDEEPKMSDFTIRLLVSGAPEHIKGDPVDRAIWLNLPMAHDTLANYAAAFNEADIGDCVYYDFESVIPQITSEMFDSMRDVQTLNKLAAEISIMSEAKQLKFKAVLYAENTTSIHDALNAAQNLRRYEFAAEIHSADAFFKEYLSKNTDARFNRKWLDRLYMQREGEEVLKHLGAKLTNYGVVSARNGHLYEPVPYYEPKAEEKLDVIEILGRRALFSNGRLMPEEIPEGLYAYDLRHNNDGGHFCSVEPNVRVNHGGTVLMRDILDFGRSGYIPLDEDTEPNFLGETMTATEFAEEEAQDETMQMGGI